MASQDRDLKLKEIHSKMFAGKITETELKKQLKKIIAPPKQQKLSETGMMCRHAYNGNCKLKCRHTVPHKHEEECQKHCRRMQVRTICIEVLFPSGASFPTFQCGK